MYKAGDGRTNMPAFVFIRVQCAHCRAEMQVRVVDLEGQVHYFQVPGGPFGGDRLGGCLLGPASAEALPSAAALAARSASLCSSSSSFSG